VQSLVAGETQVFMTPIAGALSNIRAGKLRALAVTTAKRAPSLPDVPTMAEASGKALAGFDISTWFGVFAPAGTPPEIVERLNSEMRKALVAPQMRERLAAMGAEPSPTSPGEFAAFVRAEKAKYEKVVRFSGAKVD
jgi:tripartite-type tricarboxylate transporter receptor subunit TctC